MSYSVPFLGKTVKVTVDRKLGSKHPKHDFKYEVNYGYIDGVKASDGDYLDAYILGEDAPLTEFTGKCIAVIHRTDDNDDKLIVCADAKSFTDEEIRNLTHFQEQWFQSEIVRSA